VALGQELFVRGVELALLNKAIVIVDASNEIVLITSESLAHQSTEDFSLIKMSFAFNLRLLLFLVVNTFILEPSLGQPLERVDTLCFCRKVVVESGHCG